MPIKISLSERHYVLDGLVYSADSGLADSPLAVMSVLATGDVERLELSKRFNLVLPGQLGVVVGTAVVQGSLRCLVQFDGSSKPVAIAGKFLRQING